MKKGRNGEREGKKDKQRNTSPGGCTKTVTDRKNEKGGNGKKVRKKKRKKGGS